MKKKEKKALKIPNKKVILKAPKKTLKEQLCRARRLEDLKPCRRRCERDKFYVHVHTLCDIHWNILNLLKKRREYIFAETNADIAEYKQLRGFVNEHLYKIFPRKRKHPTGCNLRKTIWKNKNLFVPGGPNQCKALNLRNGSSICGKEPARNKNSMYCENHTYLKNLHAKSYHTTNDTRYNDGGAIYNNVYRSVGAELFYELYLQFFLRLEHLTIYQMKVDHDHLHFMKGDVINRIGLNTHTTTLPEPLSFYRKLLGKFCDYNMERCKELFRDEPISSLKEEEEPAPNVNTNYFYDDDSDDHEIAYVSYLANKEANPMEPESEEDWDSDTG